MIKDIVKKRLDNVIAVDAIAESRSDFFATHVPIDNLVLLDDYEFQPSNQTDKYEKATEEEVYKKYILNPKNLHQFIAIYGEAGTGKSHLIRWFKERYEQDKPNNEVILFLSRNDNSLKGTIKQLLDKPEVKNIDNKDIFDRLTNASSSIDPNKLKDTIYHNFIIEVNSDLASVYEDNEDDPKQLLRSTTKKNLPAFLSNGIVREYMLRDGGPVERVFSKVAEQAIVNVDIEAKFIPEDFILPSDIFSELISSGADRKAEKLAKKLRTEETGYELAVTLTNYFNNLVDTVIQTCAGIEPTDFELLFMKIREQLYKEEKNLTVFIEDITSATGVNKALLNALMADHNAVENTKVCRISSIIGSTSGYFQSDIRGNYQQRVTKYVYVPMDMFDENRLYEFFGKYLNALSLEDEVIQKWVDNGIKREDYPVHEPKEGKLWDTYKLNNKYLSLFPFTKYAILNLYKSQLDQKTPRYIIKQIIRPVLIDVIFNGETFPNSKYIVKNNGDRMLELMVTNKLNNIQESDRLLRFMRIWGNAKNEQYTKDGINYIAGISEKCYEDLGLPIVNLTEVIVDEPKVNDSEDTGDIDPIEPVSTSGGTTTPTPTIDDVAASRLSRAANYLDKWVTGSPIDATSTGGDAGIISKALDDITNFIVLGIDWQIEGLSMAIRKIVNDRGKIVTLENNTKESRAFISLPCDRKSVEILMAFIRWRELGKESWNYAESYLDVYLVTNWFINNKDNYINIIKSNDQYKYSYVEYALASEIIRKIIEGSLNVDSLDKLTPKDFYADEHKKGKNTLHGTKWLGLIDWINEKNRGSSNTEHLRNTFNLRQGTSIGSKVLIDYADMKLCIDNVKQLLSKDLLEKNIPQKDILNARLDICGYYKTLKNKLNEVLKDEINFINQKMQFICNSFEIEFEDELDVDDIESLFSEISDFYSSIDKAMLHIQWPNLNIFNNKEEHIANNINLINRIVSQGETLQSLVYLSDDPYAKLDNFVKLLLKVERDLNEVDRLLGQQNIQDVQSGEAPSVKYASDIKLINNNLDVIKNVRGE